MGVDAATPPGLWERVRQIAQQEVAKLLRSGLLRNASISDGGLTIKGGFLRLLDKVLGVDLFYVGPVNPPRADGTPQQGWIVRRADGSVVLLLLDALPTDSGGALNQALNWFDRSRNVVLADDTDSGQGMARPHLNGGWSRTRFGDITVSTTSSSFETLWDTRLTKPQPKLEVWYRASMDTAGTTGEVRVLVNGQPFGAVQAQGFVLATQVVGPLPVAGDHMDTLVVEIQGRRSSASGALRVEPLPWFGRQS